VERLLDVDHRPLVSVFMPDRLRLVKRPPGPPPAPLDQLVAALWPLRAATRREYSRVLSQRNALLARIRAGSAGDATLAAWDRELALCALALRAHRARAVEPLAQTFADRAAHLGCTGDLALEYRPRSAAADEDEFCA